MVNGGCVWGSPDSHPLSSSSRVAATSRGYTREFGWGGRVHVLVLEGGCIFGCLTFAVAFKIALYHTTDVHSHVESHTSRALVD